MSTSLGRAGALLAVLAAAVAGSGAAGAHVAHPTEGRTTLTVSQAAGAAFAKAGVSAQIPSSFPVVKGSSYAFHGIDDQGAGGSLRHDGTITLSKNDTVVELEDPTITISGGDTAKGTLSVIVGGARTTIATLDLSGYEATEDDAGFAGAIALLTPEAAGLLNQTFGTTAFAGGLELGSLVTTDAAQRVRFTTRGRTTATLSQKTFKLLAKARVRVRSTGAARPFGARSVTFPIAGGRADLISFAGQIRHRGGLTFGAYRTGNYRLRHEGDRGFVIRSGLQKGLALFTVRLGRRTSLSTEQSLTIGGAGLHFAIEAARDLAPALGLKPGELAAMRIGTIDVAAPYADLAR